METKSITKYKCGICGAEEEFNGLFTGAEQWGVFEFGRIYMNSGREYKIDICAKCAQEVFGYSPDRPEDELTTFWNYIKHKFIPKDWQ